MADLTPTDIVNKEFHQTLRGYGVREVDEFLQQASDSLFHSLEENQHLRAQFEDINGRLSHYQQSEELIKNALILAEKTADETRRAARKEAELIIREAEERLRKERTELDELNQLRLRMLAEVRAALYSQLSLLESQEKRLLPAVGNASPTGQDKP